LIPRLCTEYHPLSCLGEPAGKTAYADFIPHPTGFVKRHPDTTLEEIREYFAEKITCSLVAIHYTLKRLGWRYKKKRYEPVNKAEKI